MPEPDRRCQCAGGCRAGGRCSLEMTGEDLLCDICRARGKAGKWHCHECTLSRDSREILGEELSFRAEEGLGAFLRALEDEEGLAALQGVLEDIARQLGFDPGPPP